jgi:hypothetical protein
LGFFRFLRSTQKDEVLHGITPENIQRCPVKTQEKHGSIHLATFIPFTACRQNNQQNSATTSIAGWMPTNPQVCQVKIRFLIPRMRMKMRMKIRDQDYYGGDEEYYEHCNCDHCR